MLSYNFTSVVDGVFRAYQRFSLTVRQEVLIGAIPFAVANSSDPLGAQIKCLSVAFQVENASHKFELVLTVRKDDGTTPSLTSSITIPNVNSSSRVIVSSRAEPPNNERFPVENGYILLLTLKRTPGGPDQTAPINIYGATVAILP